MAVALLKMRGFTAQDFAKFHPGGALGKRLYLTVGDLCVKNGTPLVSPDDIMTQAIIEISEKMLGAAAVIENGQLVGIVTDGDLRRMLMKHPNIETVKVRDIMTKNPLRVDKNALVADALNIMQHKEISVLPVMDGDRYIGMVHIHDIIKEGII